MSSPSEPVDLSKLVSTTILSSRGDSNRYAGVVFDPRVTNVSYRVSHAKNGEPARNVSQSGVLESKLDDKGHSFLVPVTRGMVYFIEVEMEVDGGWNESKATLSWVLDPFKRRPALTPAPAESN